MQPDWFITLGCERQSTYFPALLIKCQGVIEKFEQNRPESRKIETFTSFGVAQQDCFFRMLLHVLDYPFPGSCKFFLDFSVGKLVGYNELLSRIETESTNSAKYNLFSSSNGIVYHIGVRAMVRNIPGPSY